MRLGLCHSLRNRAKAWKEIHESSSQVAGLSVMKQLISGFTIAFALAVLSGCGGGSSSTGPQPGTNGCTSFTDATAAGASRVINFGGNLGNTYDQKCLAIAVNQQVTFSGSFTTHPLSPGLAPSRPGGTDSQNNPIRSTSSGSSASFTFVNAGTYPYYCTAHQSQGMYGAIQVSGP
jgi:plastocyanin